MDMQEQDHSAVAFLIAFILGLSTLGVLFLTIGTSFL